MRTKIEHTIQYHLITDQTAFKSSTIADHYLSARTAQSKTEIHFEPTHPYYGNLVEGTAVSFLQISLLPNICCISISYLP